MKIKYQERNYGFPSIANKSNCQFKYTKESLRLIVWRAEDEKITRVYISSY